MARICPIARFAAPEPRMPHPALSRRVVYPLQERLMKRPTFAYLESLERSQWLTREEIERLQMAKLEDLLRTAMRHSPWHAERIAAAGIDVAAGAPELTIDDLRRLPTMTKQDARANVERIRWAGVPGGAFRYNTGGSSGEPLVFFYGRRRQASDAAGRIRARRWWGVDVGDREVYLWGAPVELDKTDRIKTIRDRLLNQLVLNAFEMSAANMDAYLEAVQAFRPKCIYGYASSLALLAARAAARKVRLQLPDLRVVCTTGEPLYAHQRTLIEQVFGAPAADEFGSRDIGFTAHQTPHGQMLLLSESIILEVLDPEGRPVPAGEVGEAVMTGLCSEAQPFIRYRTGDMLRLGAEACGDGRGLHVVGEVAGRTTDFVVRADGTVMHALAVIYVLRAVVGIAAFKFVQQTVRDVEVLIVPGAGWGPAARAQVTAGLAARLGNDVRIAIRLTTAIPVEASGKHRYVVSHISPSPSLAPETTLA
jgi:phenylacetate-CoA ligase